MDVEQLPRIDEHSVVVAAPPEATWDALIATFGRSLSSSRGRQSAWLLGCRPDAAVEWERAAPGSTLPGFRVVVAEPPHLLVVTGEHRFSHYGIAWRVVASGAGSRCSAESRAAFPGVHGRLYRLAVIGSGGHVVAVRRLLAGVRREAERPPA